MSSVVMALGGIKAVGLDHIGNDFSSKNVQFGPILPSYTSRASARSLRSLATNPWKFLRASSRAYCQNVCLT